MPVMNGIQSTAPSFLQPKGLPAEARARYSDSQSQGLDGDRYSGSTEAWRNRATFAAGQTTCQCGNCPACAAQAYAAQGQALKGEKQDAAASPSSVQETEGAEGKQSDANASKAKGVDGEVLSQQEQAKLVELKKIDRAVRAHEQAHVAAAGNLVRRGVSLSYEKGPDGRRYAVAGEVSIDTSKEAEPADTINKMRTVRAAALAPAEPSAQDRKVAAAATVTMTNAMSELQLARAAEQEGAVDRAAEGAMGRDTEKGDSGQDVPAIAAPADTPTPQRTRAIGRYSQSPNATTKSLTMIA